MSCEESIEVGDHIRVVNGEFKDEAGFVTEPLNKIGQ
jgi:transcription antitermination factor NusG